MAENTLTAAPLAATAATAAAEQRRGRVRARAGRGGGGTHARTGGAEPGRRVRARVMLSGRQGALLTHAVLCLPPSAVRRGSIGAAAEKRLAPF
jgi:hypothetical protein